MRDGVTGIPTAPMQAQVQQLIDHLRAEVDGIEQGSEVMLKTVYDADGDGVVDEAAAAPWSGITAVSYTHLERAESGPSRDEHAVPGGEVLYFVGDERRYRHICYGFR